MQSVCTLWESDGVSVTVAVDMLVTMLCILNDSTHVTSVLLDDFAAAQGYSTLVKFITE